MVIQGRLGELPLRQALAKNPVVKAKIENCKVEATDLGEISDEGLEDLGLVLPCDDSQLRVVQLTGKGCSLQVEGPPGTGKSQTIANIISNALYLGQRVLLVCDKKAAIVQVEERLSNCGLKPALLNLHDEDLDKRDFLRQSTSKFPPEQDAGIYPLDQLKATRATLNDRVKFGRSISHPSLQVSKRDALAGLIQLRKELHNVPKIDVPNWQALSKDRLDKLLGCLGQWPDLESVLTNANNVWNTVCVEAFDANPNAINELQVLAHKIIGQLESLDRIREYAATVGIEMPLNSDTSASAILALVQSVQSKPNCHPRLLGNKEVNQPDLKRLKAKWDRSVELRAANYPVVLTEVVTEDARNDVAEILTNECAQSWADLSKREHDHIRCRDEIASHQNRYRRICDQIGLVYSPLLKVRRAQFQFVTSLAVVGKTIPRGWWKQDMTPVLMIAGWKANLKACATHMKSAPLPLHCVALERVSKTHWSHVEAKAEHGFNFVSYCLNFVNDRKCKYALRQIYPNVPQRGFKKWQDLTLHAVTAFHSVSALRTAAETHIILKEMTSAYLTVAHEKDDHAENYLSHDDVYRLGKAAAFAEQIQARNDLFEVGSPHWQTFWEAPSQSLVSDVKSLLDELDALSLPNEQQNDDLENALVFHDAASRGIRQLLQSYERQEGDRDTSVLAAFSAQREFQSCQAELAPLARYIELQGPDKSEPDWTWLRDVISWRDAFERKRGQQKLDLDSALWGKLRLLLDEHCTVMSAAYKEIDGFFEGDHARLPTYEHLTGLIVEILDELPRHPLWLEKRRWQGKIPAFPEIKTLWQKLLDGSVEPQKAQRLFCFNLLRHCDPIAKPHGPDFKQTIKTFTEQDDKLSSWILDHLKAAIRKSMREAVFAASNSEARLRHLAGLQRIRGTVRELVNEHLDYLLAAKPCWLMSPTSLANLIDSRIFEEHGTPFDVVIFDEASQVRVMEGLLAMSFGKQVVIVGDKNQLPPTDFFTSFANPDADAAGFDFGVSESLLNEFETVFDVGKSQLMLMSHYRSETPDLIRFSNDWFYDGKLEMYPPAHVAGIGRQLHYVPNAVYSEISGQRNNPVEARAVVELIERHVREWPGKSLGVVAMNIPQMELIEEQIQLLAPAQVRTFCSDESRFFLRNLETVQGDEMDRIILSLTYGKNIAGQFSASILGPLTKSGGERRLNVAITRSRSGMIVVSSLKSSDLDASSAQSTGFKCLKAFLTDLENTERARTFGIISERFKRKIDGVSNVVFCDSPFEEQVVEFLENEGYEIECQYGAGKFRLDIVVKDGGKILLAIECDGAAYHSSLVARTRDRARQRVLERLGWRIHRVWSTNWWFYEDQEKQSIRDAINAARTLAIPSRIAARNTAQ